MKHNQSNKRLSADAKMAILKEHLLNGVAVSDVCDKHNIKVSTYYLWQKELFTRGDLVFSSNHLKSHEKRQTAKIKALEEKLHRKNEVLSELMEEHVSLKKHLGS